MTISVSSLSRHHAFASRIYSIMRSDQVRCDTAPDHTSVLRSDFIETQARIF